MSTMQTRPWEGAQIHEGTIPQQAILYPLPVLLRCEDCCQTGYWYPGDNRIDTRSGMCPGPDGWRPYHAWVLRSWNGNGDR